jgi:polyphosphate kinase 2 (PPK2 family)
LNVSKKEQKKRFLDRLQEPDKHWKFAARDLHERDFWDDYQNAYEEMIQATATADAPWYVVPADNKWFTRIIVAAAIVETLDSLKLQYPQVTDELMKELETARALLLKNG